MKTQILVSAVGLVLLIGACKGGGSYDVSKEASASADSAAVSSLADNASSKLVKTADMRLKVKDVPKTSEVVGQLTRSLGGMVMHHHMASEALRTEDFKKSNDSLLRVSLHHYGRFND